MAFGLGCLKCCATTGCTSKTIGGYDEYLESFRAAAARVGQFASAFTITSVTIVTDGLTYPLSTPPAANTTPVLELWGHDAVNNLPNMPSVGGSPVPDILATFTPPASFDPGDWVFTHAGYTVAANTYYWIVLRHNGLWAYWDENCGSNTECQAACCDYWTQGTLGGGQSIWDGAAYCNGYVLSINQ